MRRKTLAMLTRASSRPKWSTTCSNGVLGLRGLGQVGGDGQPLEPVPSASAIVLSIAARLV